MKLYDRITEWVRNEFPNLKVDCDTSDHSYSIKGEGLIYHTRADESRDLILGYMKGHEADEVFIVSECLKGCEIYLQVVDTDIDGHGPVMLWWHVPSYRSFEKCASKFRATIKYLLDYNLNVKVASLRKGFLDGQVG